MNDAPLIPKFGTAANPKRRFKKKTYVIDGQPILRVMEDGLCNHKIRDGVTVASVHNAVDGIRRCKSGVAMFRMCGLIFDMPHITFPTVDQQFRSLEHYANNSENLLFDGWRDVIVQKLDPQVTHSSINQKPCMREFFKQAHFTHIAATSLAFTKERGAIPLTMCGLGVRGKTFAILDLGVDTLAYPEQLIGAAPLVASTEGLLVGRMSQLMQGDSKRLGWEMMAGRYVPKKGRREFLEKFAKLVDQRFAKSDPIPLVDYRRCYVDGHNGGTQCILSRTGLDAVYTLVRLGFPIDGSVSVMKAVIEKTGFRRSLGREIDYEYARSLLASAMSGDNAISEAIALRYAGKFQSEILSRAQQGYLPDFMHPSLVHGLEEGEKRESVSAKYGKRSVWRDVARTALGIVEAVKETPQNTAVRRAMRRHFVELIDKANRGILEQNAVFAQPSPNTHLMPLFREIAKNEDALRMFSQFCSGKRLAERELQSLCENFPEWGAVIVQDWEGFLKDSLEKAKALRLALQPELDRAGSLPVIPLPEESVDSPVESPASKFSDSA